jgi:putative flavoprotein involved in K+ transport
MARMTWNPPDVPERLGRRAVVIGAGPGGLSAAWALKRVGVEPLVLERADRVCSSWHRHYRSLQLNSPRRLSSLPGMRMERRLGRWVGREDFIGYVERYAEMVGAQIVFETEARRIDRDGEGWAIVTSRGRICSRHVVIATGMNAIPALPDWVGRDEYVGAVAHVRDHDRLGSCAGKDLLVVGLGSSGTDLAVELRRAEARRVRVSVRTPPLIYRRHLSTAILGQIAKHAPVPGSLVDVLSLRLHGWLWGDLSAYGLRPPALGMVTRLAASGHGVTFDRGLVDAVRRGQIEIVAAVQSFERDHVVLVDGTRISPDVVIAATGQRPNLAALIGHLPGVLDDRGFPTVHGADVAAAGPGLHFLGYRAPGGQLMDMAIDARRVARRVARELAR